MHLILVYHSVQFSHTWSGFSRLLRVMISEIRILCHFILSLMKQLACNVDIISLIRIFSFGYLVGVIYSMSQELTLVVFVT